jgi:hypothetical protein
MEFNTITYAHGAIRTTVADILAGSHRDAISNLLKFRKYFCLCRAAPASLTLVPGWRSDASGHLRTGLSTAGVGRFLLSL